MSIQSELLEIKGDRELLTAEDVVNWARSHPDSELYKAPEFCGWNESEAAWQHWLWGARRLIALHIVYENGERKFVSLSLDRTREKGGYRDIDDVLRDQTLHEIMMADALRDFQRMESKYERLKQLRPVWHAVAKVRTRRTKQNARQAERSAAEHG